MLLFTFLTITTSQLTYNQLQLGCLTVSGTTCTKLCPLGQQDCKSSVICEYGYFLFNSDCVMCPYQNVADALTLYCMDCVEHPYTWYSSRTCTYEYTIENGDQASGTYVKSIKEYSELYYIGPAIQNGVNQDTIPRDTQFKYQTYICSGCQSFCDPKIDKKCNSICSPYTEDPSVVGVKCLSTYEFKQSMCVSCPSDCLQCTNGSCTQCMSGYMIKFNGCTKCQSGCLNCYIIGLQQMCLQCETGYVASLDQQRCESCGNECARCEYVSFDSSVDQAYPTRNMVRVDNPSVANLYIKRCRQCATSSFISHNGVDCVTCQIRNCDVCYYSIRGSVTTMDYDFEPSKSNDNVSSLLCFKCKSEFLLSSDSQTCGAVPPPPANIVENCDRNYLSGINIMCLQCLSNLILDQSINGCFGQCTSYISYCSICYSYKSRDTTNYMDNSGQVHTRAAQTLFQCISCDSGYYPNIFTGYCDPCPGNCAQCWQYSRTYNFTDFLTRMEPLNMATKEVFLNDIPIQVQCTSCSVGYQLYGNDCLGCTSDCQVENPAQNPLVMDDDLINSCVFKSKYAFCGECYDPYNDRSLVADKSECTSCPVNCVACRDRVSSEITNAYFNPDNENLQQYGRLCYKTQSMSMSPLISVSYNSLLNLPISCIYSTASPSNTKRCKHTAAITVSIYCDQTEYDAKIATLAAGDLMFHYYLNDYYYLDSEDSATINFGGIETFDVYQRMNQMTLESLQLTVKFVSSSTHICTFPKTTSFESNWQKNVYALTNFEMSIQSADATPITFLLTGSLKWENFQNVKLSNINIYPESSIISNFGLSFYGSLPTIVTLESCILGYSAQKSTTQSFSLSFTNIQELNLNDLTIQYLTSSDDILLDQSNLGNYMITMKDIVFQHSQFMDSIIFPLSPFANIEINGLTLLDCTLDNTQFFQDHSEYQVFTASLTVSKLTIRQTQFYNSSSFVDSSNLNFFSLDQIDVIGNNFNSSEIFVSNTYTASNIYIYGNVFTNNSLMFRSADQVPDSVLFKNQIINIPIVMSNIKFTSNTCYNINCFMILQTPFNPNDLTLSLIMTNLYIYNNYIEIDMVKTQSVSSAIVRITQVKTVTFTNIVIDTQLSITVISLQEIASLDVNTFLCDWSNPQVGPKDMDPRTKVVNATTILFPFNNKIPSSSDCSIEKYQFGSYNGYCLHVQDFLYGVQIQNAALKGLLGIDTGFIYIQSYQSLIKQTSDYSDSAATASNFYYQYVNEVVILKNINIFNTSISAVSPVSNLAAIVIKSDQLQTVIIDSVLSDGNHLHQQVESINLEIAPCFVLLSTNGNLTMSNLEFQNNRATQSYYGINVIKCYQLSISNSLFNYTNYLESNWLERMDEQQITQYPQLLGYFSIESFGANLYIQSKVLSLDSMQFLNGFSQCGTSIYFSGQDVATISVSNSQFINQSASLEYVDASMGGSLYLDCQKSKFNLTLSSVTMKNSRARSKGGCIYIDPSIYQQIILISNSQFEGCQSLSSSVLDISFSVSNKVLPTVMIKNSNVLNNQFSTFLQLLPDISLEEELIIIAGTALFVQNYGTLTIQSTKFSNTDIQGLLQLTNMVQVILQDVAMQSNKLFIQSLIEITLYQKFSQLSINNVLISNVTEQIILNSAQFSGIYNAECTQLTSLFTSANTQECSEQSDLRSFYQNIYNYRQIAQTKLDNSTLYEYYDSLSYGDKYNLGTIHLDTPSIVTIYQQSEVDIIQNQIAMIDYELCYMTYLSETYSIVNKTALIKLSPVKQSAQISISQITVKNNKCLRCEGGLVQVNNQDISATNTFITQMICSSNIIGYFGCLAITTQNKAAYTVRRILAPSDYNIHITQSTFKTNTAQMGAGVAIIGLSANVSESIFSDNNASQVGGAMLFVYDPEVKNILNQYKNDYLRNTAQLGSAIYMKSNTLNDETKSLLYIYHNEGTQVEAVPQKLTLRMKSGQLIKTKIFGSADGDLNDDGVIDSQNAQMIDILDIKGTTLPQMSSEYLLLPSGQQISKYKYYYSDTQEQVPYGWILRIINLDSNGKEVNSISSSETCNIAGRLMDQNNLDYTKQFLMNFTSVSVVSFDTVTQAFNLDNLQIYFDPYFESNLFLQLKFTCTSIKIPIYNQDPPYDVSSFDTNYALYANVRTIPCQVGEAYIDQKCSACDAADTYSVQENSVECKGINSIEMDAVLPVRIKLNPQYWRPFPLNDNIEQCYNLVTNCLGGWVAGDVSCFDGHVGALCEQCDIYGIRGPQYSVSKKYTCGACADTMQSNILIIIGISVFTLVTMVMSVKGNYEFIENLVHQQVLQSIGARTNFTQNNASILMKQLTNYLQIIAALTTFRISLPTIFVSSMEVLGNPTQSMAYSLDCFLVSIAPFDLLYFRMAWALLMPIFYVLIFFIGYFTGVLARLAPFKIGVVYTTFIYMFIYLQPTLVGGFMALLSSRTISGVEWVQGNVSYQYYTDMHSYFLLVFIGPNLLLWSMIFPLAFMQCVRRNKHQLEKMQVQKKWGFFYHEYTSQAYLWEFVKIFEKELVIIALTYYENKIVIKGLIVFLIVFLYGAFSFAFIPYKQNKLNFVDQMTTAVCACSLCLGVLIYASQSENLDYLQYIMFMIIAAINALLILLILFHLFKGYVDKFDDKLDTIRDKVRSAYPNIDFQYPCIKKLLINKKQMKSKVSQYWATLRYETREGIKRRRADKTAPLFLSQRRKSTSVSQDITEKDFHSSKQGSSIDQQDPVVSPSRNFDGESKLLKRPESSSGLQGLIVRQNQETSPVQLYKIYPEVGSDLASSRKLDTSPESKKKKIILKHQL